MSAQELLADGAVRGRRAEIEPKQNALGLRHVADEPAKGQRQLLDQGRRGDDLLAYGQRRMLGDIHDLQLVASFQMLLANLPDVQDCPRGLQRGAGDVEPQDVVSIGARHCGGTHQLRIRLCQRRLLA